MTTFTVGRAKTRSEADSAVTSCWADVVGISSSDTGKLIEYWANRELINCEEAAVTTG